MDIRIAQQENKTFCKKYKDNIVTKEELYGGCKTIYKFKNYIAEVSKHRYSNGLEMIVIDRKTDKYVSIHPNILRPKHLEILLDEVKSL